jgi:hypothetical protein
MTNSAGYSQQERRRIEHEAFSGNLLGIIATNALELGVDIGVLDAVIMLGFPFGIANFVCLFLGMKAFLFHPLTCNHSVNRLVELVDERAIL